MANELAKNCPAPKLEDYYSALGSLMQKRKNYIDDQLLIRSPFLEALAAGNSGRQVDSLKDHFTCEDPSRDEIVIGALTASGELASFSERGRCVSGYTYVRKLF